MSNRNNQRFPYNLIAAFAIIILPVGQVGVSLEQVDQSRIKTLSIQEDMDGKQALGRQDSDVDYQTQYARFRDGLECLALNIYFEARSEPALGRRAVGHVVMNRVNHDGFPNSVCGVVRQGGSRVPHRCQFSWWCDGRSDTPYNRVLWLKSLKLALEIYTGFSEDPTGGALWYHADYTKPSWSRAFQRGPKIGHHIFYRENRPKSDVL